jgi:hypothetical protein
MAGWAATRQFSAEWISAVGTWVGALATVGTIIWAVLLFRHESRVREEARDTAVTDKRAAEDRLAESVAVRCFGGGGYGPDGDKTMTNVNVEVLNGTTQATTLHGFSLPEVSLRDPIADIGLPLAMPPHERIRVPVTIDPIPAPDNQFSGRPLTLATPIIRYQVGGVMWERRGDDPPTRT